MCQVVELDLPWDESPTSYGPSFNAWSEDTFAQAMGVIASALPHNDIVTVVSISHLVLTLSQVYHSLNQRDFVQRILRNDHKYIPDFYMFKIGKHVLLSHSFQIL